MDWALALIALCVLAVMTVSRRLEGTPVTPQMLFLVLGVLLGPEVLDGIQATPTGEAVRTLAEATLALVLFGDASRIDLRALRAEYQVPVRLLGIGLPLTLAAGTAAAAAIFGNMTLAEAAVLGILLAPTDAALGQAVVVDERLPSRVRQGLNVESGLNDGICVPLLYVAIAAADVESSLATGQRAFTIAAEEIGFGVLGGLAAGALAAALMHFGERRGLIASAWRQAGPVAGAVLAYETASALGGSGFIAAFVAGMLFGGLLRGRTEAVEHLNEELGALLNGVTFVVFGAILLGPSLGRITLAELIYALLSLTLVRMVPVALALLRTGTRRPTVLFLGWFGPRGLASIVFALIVVLEANLPQGQTIAVTAYLAVALSTLAHGISAAPLAGRYARWLAGNAPESLSETELGHAPAVRARGAAARALSELAPGGPKRTP